MNDDFSPEYDHVHALERRVEKESASGDSRALDELLSFYDRILGAAPGTRDAELSEYPPIFEPLGRLFHAESPHAPLFYRWLLSVAPRCSEAQRVSLRISFLEGWPVEPVSWSELETIWLGFWNAPETRWVVLDAYIWVPLKLEPHRRKFAEIARARGLEIAPLDEGEHADLLRECANPLDAAEVADELESFLKDKDPAAWEWDEFIHQPQSDPRVEAMRQRCVGLDLSTAEGREILREELRRLRSDEERGG